MIAPAEPGALLRCGEQRVDLGARQRTDVPRWWGPWRPRARACVARAIQSPARPQSRGWALRKKTRRLALRGRPCRMCAAIASPTAGG